MIRRAMSVAFATAVLAASTAFAAAVPPPAPIYVQFSGAAKGALYKPDPGLFPSPHIGVIAMHRNSNYLNHISTKELPARGFVVLGMNPRCDNNEAACAPWENNALDVKAGVNYLRSLPGITKVVLLGHSGGGPTMTFYEAVAEKGVAFCQQPGKLIKCSNSLAGLPKVDGVITMDAHPGNGINAVRSISANVTNDSAVLNQNRKPSTNPNLDPFDARNGYRDGGLTIYSDTFKKAYFKAQADRMNFLIGEALARLDAINAAGDSDAPFIVPLADNARLSQIDLTIHHGTLLPRKLLKNDGSVDASQPVASVRKQSLSPGDEEGFGSSMFLTVKSFLSVRAVRSTDSFDGVDWCSSNNSTPCNLQNMTAPLLVTAMGGHYFIRDAEQYFDMAASPDKDFYVIEGATHGGGECTACETTPGQYKDATKNLFNLMRDWMNARF
jgi:hypothetical protein